MAAAFVYMNENGHNVTKRNVSLGRTTAKQLFDTLQDRLAKSEK